MARYGAGELHPEKANPVVICLTWSSVPTPASGQEPPNTGQLALYLLALRAACQDMETPLERQLVTQLKLHLHKEKASIGKTRDPGLAVAILVGRRMPFSTHTHPLLGVLCPLPRPLEGRQVSVTNSSFSGAPSLKHLTRLVFRPNS